MTNATGPAANTAGPLDAALTYTTNFAWPVLPLLSRSAKSK